MREDWIEEELGKVCFTTSGGTPSRRNSDYYNGIIPWVKSGELDKGIIYDTEEKISDEAIKKSSAKLFPKGTLLIALYGATIGKLAFLGVEASTNQAICGIFQSKAVNSNYLYNFLLFKRPKLVSQGTGGAQPNISQTILKKLQIPLAPLPIQRAIVSKIETLFSDLDNGIADLKKAQAQLKIYRQAVLKKAFEGAWKETTVGDLFDFVGGGTPSKKEKDYWNGDIPWASVKDIKGDYLTSTQDYITNKGLQKSSSNLALKEEVIIITRISPGKAILTKIDTAINQDLKIAKPKAEMYNRYIFFLFKSIERECVKLSSGTTVLGINLQNLKSIQIPDVDRNEQHQIVREIESRLSVCDKVEQNITEALNKSEALRQSILKKAFEGKLLSEAEIAQCKQEADYEPAQLLLERIKQRKDAMHCVSKQ
ncbi:restriction endonuclease subunit S [Saccharicrinis sp. 156]|uniref:restriction endonuclease subunit S n=1 Tax=Saccharicrinis sp. 156 TaxID=3417574 RepID=UPI003D3499DC